MSQVCADVVESTECVCVTYRQTIADRSTLGESLWHWVINMPNVESGIKIEGTEGSKDICLFWNVSADTDTQI